MNDLEINSELDEDFLTDDQVDSYLKYRGIDVSKAFARVKAALHWEKIRQFLENHSSGSQEPFTGEKP